jgi:hypothetical protein
LHVLSRSGYSAEVAVRPSSLHRSLFVVRHEKRGDVAQQQRHRIASKYLREEVVEVTRGGGDSHYGTALRSQRITLLLLSHIDVKASLLDPHSLTPQQRI